MKLKQFRVREFRSVWDSEPVTVDPKVTCLVGKNEAGKTALLEALYRTNPIIAADAAFDITYDYPKREVEDYRIAVENGERDQADLVECTWLIEDADKAVVTALFGPDVLTENTLTRTTYYGREKWHCQMRVNESAAREHLASNDAFSEPIRETLRASTEWTSFSTALGAAEQTDAVKKTAALVSEFKQDGLGHYIFNKLLWPRAPKMLYFDEYYQMQGRANLNALIQREAQGKLEASDYPLLGLINLARLDHKKLVESKNTQELKNKLENAGNYLTSRIIKYWSQNKHIKMEFDVREAKPEDPENMRAGINIWGEVHDTVHWAHTPLGTRSRGFVWFFSFLAWFEDVKRKKEHVVLLLDEPGLSLHGRAQADLLRYFEQELGGYQMIYSTHSPFMIDPQHFERVRIVQDLGIDSQDQLPKETDGTKVVAEVFDATADSLFPLQGALGYEIHQTLFIGPNSLVVEGPADMLFLKAISAQLERDGKEGLSEKWVITPVGGSGKVPTFVALLAPQRGMNIATLLDISADDKNTVENLYKKKLLKKKQVRTYGEYRGVDEADVEDMFDRDFYVSLVNAEFGDQLKAPLDVQDLNAREPRVLRAIEAHLTAHPLKRGSFGHYRPARYFFENASTLWPSVSKTTRERFAAAFHDLNELLR